MGARTLFSSTGSGFAPHRRASPKTPAKGMWVFKMLPFLATRSLILLMMLASKLQGKNGQNKNRIRIRISQAKAKTVGNENDKKFLQQCTEKNGHNGTCSPRAGLGMEYN